MSKYSHSDSVPSQDLFLVPRSQKIMKMGAIFVLFLLLAGGATLIGLSYYSSRSEKADALLSKALSLYVAPLLDDKSSEDVVASSETPRFKTAEERAQASLKMLEQLYRDFGSSSSSSLGKILQARILLEQGKAKEAQELYQKELGSQTASSPVWNALFQENQAIALELQNKKGEAAKIYEEQLAKIPSFYKSFFSLGQALLQTELGKTKEASELYKKVVQDAGFSSSFRTLAESKI